MRRALVTGGAGFIGSHLSERLIADGYRVVVVDDLSTGRFDNIAPLAATGALEFVEADVVEPIAVPGSFDVVMHLASAASPADYTRRPVETLLAGSAGTRHALELAKETGARMIFASSSEVYGDPLVHPQPEDYRGNVDPVGPRSSYDEAKRFGEALTTAFASAHGVNAGIARIFNTYGPRMRTSDGRAVPQFIAQALADAPLTVHGDGAQTRSLCYVDDIVDGLVRLARSHVRVPVNLGGTDEITMLQLAQTIAAITGSASPIVHADRPPDDPQVRRPDIGRARDLLDWAPTVPLDEGLRRTIDHARGRTDG